MTSIHILFLGWVDDLLVTRLEARGYDVQIMGANHGEIWSLERLHASQDTGYYMSWELQELFDEASRDTCEFVIVRISPSFAIEEVPKLPPAVRAKLLLDFGRVLSTKERAAFTDIGCRNFASRRKDESALDWVLNHTETA